VTILCALGIVKTGAITLYPLLLIVSPVITLSTEPLASTNLKYAPDPKVYNSMDGLAPIALVK
jgi:hypothetical protein